jgi:hypothetical protein
MSHYIDSVDLVPNLPQTCFCKDKPTSANGGSIKYDGRRVYFELDPRTQVAIESVLGQRVTSTYAATPLSRSWAAPVLPELGGFFDPKTGVYGHPICIPEHIRLAWRDSLSLTSTPVQDGLGAVFICDEIKGLSREDIEKATSGSSITASQLEPGDAGADRQKLIDLARAAEIREARNSRIAAAIAIGSISIAAIGLYMNYSRRHAAAV